MMKKFVFFCLNMIYVQGFLNSCMPNVCIIKTGNGNPDLLPVISKRMLQNTNAVVICDDKVNNNIKEIINCHSMYLDSSYTDKQELLSNVAAHLLNHRPVYRLMPEDQTLENVEITEYKRWGVEITMIPCVKDNIKYY